MTTPTVNIVRTVAELRAEIARARREGKRIGLVPTMGALHEGHLSLVRASRAECGYTVASIFVNPTQFGRNEDFARYPRTLEADAKLLGAAGTDLAFVPDADEVYPPGSSSFVDVGPVAEPLEGQFRPGHFRGVATVVLKLFNMVQPDVAFFGQKDFQQTAVIRRMVADLNVPVAICVCPTIREPDGLAMSSRNRYLSPDARRRALVLSQSLQLAAKRVDEGQRDADRILAEMRSLIETAHDAQIDYVALVAPHTLQPVRQITGQTLAVLAVKIENTRLIDNALVEPPKQ